MRELVGGQNLVPREAARILIDDVLLTAVVNMRTRFELRAGTIWIF